MTMLLNRLFSRTKSYVMLSCHMTKTTAVRLTSSTKSKGGLHAANEKRLSQVQSSIAVSSETGVLVSRILAAFGILHVVTEYCFDLTRCEGPSMMPTIKPSGEIIVMEKFTHRIYGIQGGNHGETRAKEAKANQKAWEVKEHKEFLASNRKSDVYVPTWHERKLPQANEKNYDGLSTFNEIFVKFTSGINVGDVIVLEHPDREGTVCKRVLGLPGDFILRPTQSSFYSSEHRNVMGIFEEDGDEEGKSLVTSLSKSSLEVVPDGHIWVEGDNSINSADSRNYGSIPSALVVGKVWFRIWPIRGFAQMVRGGRPMPPKNAPYTGSTIIPAGCEGEEQIIKKL